VPRALGMAQARIDMISYQTTSAALGLLVAISILLLVRRDHLHSRHAVWWIVIAAAVIVFGFFPRIIDWLGEALGVAYPPVLALVGGIALLLIKVLLQDLENTRQERQIRRLAQRLAIYEEGATKRRGPIHCRQARAINLKKESSSGLDPDSRCLSFVCWSCKMVIYVRW